MSQYISNVSLLVKDYDEAIAFYTQKLGFTLVEDTKMDEHKRWVRVAPPGNSACCLLLAKATNETQNSRIGNQTGGRVFLFLYTDHFWEDYERMQKMGIHFIRPASDEAYGLVAVFEDLHGNLWDFIQPKQK